MLEGKNTGASADKSDSTSADDDVVDTVEVPVRVG